MPDIIPTEHAEQVTFVAEFRRRWPDVRIFAIPNGGYRHKATADKLHREGVSPGVPDLFVPAWRLWIEMKRSKGGRLSPDQKSWIEYLESEGYACIVAKGWENGIREVEEWLSERG